MTLLNQPSIASSAVQLACKLVPEIAQTASIDDHNIRSGFQPVLWSQKRGNRFGLLSAAKKM